MSMDKVFSDHAHYLSDVYGLDYTSLARTPMDGWDDPSTIFCDNVVFWCLIHWIAGASFASPIRTYMALVRGIFGEYLERSQYKVALITKGIYTTTGYDYFPEDMQQLKAKDMGLADFMAGYIAIKVSFENVLLDTLLSILKKVTRLLKEEFVVLHDLDVGIDLARISNRTTILRYLLDNGLREDMIVDDRHSVGDNCISWRSYTFMKKHEKVPIRIKLYNKFIQMLESAQVRCSIGSQLSYLVANTDRD
ncbi:MAG: hypothetical protein EXX96DRAFT_280715 [Benjaminiella poitrasii]|nr:MAG: hypothetical protein EXX96DRAFT_280715 [Benjaminiella poitrasii]